MSFLTPLYILGALAIAGPIVFHLIRRTPKGEVPFSSLMFLSPTPPRLTRRSRLDDILLLVLRAAALALLAAAFARPFLREAASLSFGDPGSRRVVVLIDTSASMRRGGLWERAKAEADRAIAEGRPGDQWAVLAFDSSTRPIMSFAESATLDPERRRAVARAGLARLSPTWGSTDLGQALVDAVAAVEDVGDATEKAGRMPRRVILVSDLQQGSRLDALGEFEWPSDVTLELRTVRAGTSNAAPQWPPKVEGTPADPDPLTLRVRVVNAPGPGPESFALSWSGPKGEDPGPKTPAYVPPGEGRVVRVPPPKPGQVLRLEGDGEPFDNALYLAASPAEEAGVLFVGGDAADDPNGLLYYLQRALDGSPGRPTKVTSAKPAGPIAPGLDRSTRLAVVAAEVSPEDAGRLREFARGGGTVLMVLTSAGPSATLASLAESPGARSEESPAGRDAMLGEIAFDHPLFAPLAGAQFNDFTRIRFWKHRTLAADSLPGARVLARFEGGDPAVLERAIGRGRLVVFASGWGPVDSQLARSSKFVPLMASLLEGREPPPVDPSGHKVGEPVPLPGAPGTRSVRRPDGSVVAVEAGTARFDRTELPGVYTVEGGGPPRSFAVNLDPSESRTAPLAVEALEQLGCKMAGPSPGEVDRDHLRQMQNAELEGRQKLWRALILAAIGVLIVETILAGRSNRPRAEARAP